MSEITKKEKHIVDELYGEHSFVYQPLGRNIIIFVLIFSVIFGAVAGVVGDFLAKTYLYEYFFGTELYSYPSSVNKLPSGENLLSIKKVSAEDFNEIEKKIHQTSIQVKKSVVNFYEKKLSSETIISDMYIPSTRVGQGVVLTSDGWIITNHNIVSSGMVDNLVVVFDDVIYPIEATVFDTASNAVFVKINANHLSVVALGDQTNLRLGQMMLAINGVGQLSVVNLKSDHFVPMSKESDAVFSSDRLYDLLLIDRSLGNEYNGSPLFALDGKLFGVISSNPSTGLISGVIPVNHFETTIDKVFKDAKISRAYIGVQYIDLSLVTIDPATFTSLGFSKPYTKGAYIFADKKMGYAGVLPDSPAQQAGLLANDIITKVDDTVIDNTLGFSDLIARYQPGDTVKLTIVRNKNTSVIEVVLSDVAPFVETIPKETVPAGKKTEKKK